VKKLETLDFNFS